MVGKKPGKREKVKGQRGLNLFDLFVWLEAGFRVALLEFVELKSGLIEFVQLKFGLLEFVWFEIYLRVPSSTSTES